MSISRTQRRLVRAASLGIVLSLAPIVVPTGSVQAERAAVAVTGLARGAQGDAVKSVQEALVARGVSVSGGVDGVFGPATEAAVRAFQRSSGLSESGQVDEATAIALGLASSPLVGLVQGQRSDAVRGLQQRLIDAGVAVPGGADGVFGPATKAALESFQRSSGLPVSGAVDAATAGALASKEAPGAGPAEAAAETAPEVSPEATPDAESSTLVGLTMGSRGDAVRRMQQALMSAGYTVVGGADGIFGPNTEAVLKAFQRRNDLSPSGAVDAATAKVLAPSANDSPAPSTSGSDAGALVGLRIGSRGNDVERLQQTLMDAGFTVVGGADGIFGALTANALKSFQNANGVEVTGAVDDATGAALAAVLAPSGGAAEHDPTVTNPFVGLQYGSLGADVKALQSELISAGISVRGGADGVFGPATRDAVRAFQSRHGIEQTGKVDSSTADALSSGSPSTGDTSLVGLKAGALGNTVKNLQQAMIDAGVTVRGGADGIFGPATANAVKDFQKSQGLEATGVVDAATAAALDAPKPVGVTGGDADTGGFAVFGEKGTRVIALQSALVEAGISVRGGVDGQFGGGTSAAVMEFQRQAGLDVTGRVTNATAERLGLQRLAEPPAPDPASVDLEVFPVQGRCYYSDTWGYPRSGGRVHLGVDIIAPEGKLLYAVVPGKITKVYEDYPGSLAGNGVRLTMDDGTYFFYAHMAEVAEGIELGVPVKAGQVLGTVGTTGSSGTNHLHLEIHPQGGSAINPYPLVKAIDGCSNEEPLPQP